MHLHIALETAREAIYYDGFQRVGTNGSKQCLHGNDNAKINHHTERLTDLLKSIILTVTQLKYLNES